MKAPSQRFRIFPATYAVCRLPAESVVPNWATGEFVNVTSTADELAIICASERVPNGVRAERDWRILKLVGPFPFTATGVLASIAAPLAEAGISLLSIATYDTDYLLVKAERLDDAVRVLVAAGHIKL